MNGLLMRAQATAQVMVENLASPELGRDDAHHLTKVLRLREGETVIATNGRGSWRTTMWSNGSLTPNGDIETEPEPRATAIAFALTKGDKPEWTVQKVTELGVMRIVPFTSAFTVVKWDSAKREKNIIRLRRIAYEASMQSRRVWLPVIDSIASFQEIATEGFIIAAPGGRTLTPADTKIAIGPEGGWSESELEAARDRLDLGPSILRAETAAIAAAAGIVRTF